MQMALAVSQISLRRVEKPIIAQFGCIKLSQRLQRVQGSTRRKKEPFEAGKVIRLVNCDPLINCQFGLLRLKVRSSFIPIAPLAQETSTLPGPAGAMCSSGSGKGL